MPAMERRHSSRLPAQLPARLTVLTDQDSPPPPATQVTIEEFSGNGARIWTPSSLPIGSLVKLELEDDLFLGEVRHSTPYRNGFHLGLHLDCALASLSGVRALMLALMNPGSRSGRSEAVDPGDQRDHQQHRQSHQQHPA